MELLLEDTVALQKSSRFGDLDEDILEEAENMEDETHTPEEFEDTNALDVDMQ